MDELSDQYYVSIFYKALRAGAFDLWAFECSSSDVSREISVTLNTTWAIFYVLIPIYLLRLQGR